MGSRIVGTFITAIIGVSVMGFDVMAQSKFLADSITFRVAGNNNRWTNHYGNMMIQGNQGAPNGYKTLTVTGKSTNTTNGHYAVYATDTATAGYGMGGYFMGGSTGITACATKSGTGSRLGGIFAAYNGTIENTAVNADANGSGTAINYGVKTSATGGATTYGIKTLAASGTGVNTGIDAIASGGITTYGIKAWAYDGKGITSGINASATISVSGATAYGIKATASSSLTTGTIYTYGIYASATQPVSCGGRSIGVYANAESGDDPIAVYGKTNTPSGYGGYFEVGAASTGGNAGHFVAQGPGSTAGYFTTFGANSCAGYFTTNGNATSYAGYFVGTTYCSDGVWSGSDSKLKKDVAPLQNALSKIMKLQPKTYSFDTASHPKMKLPSQKQYGLLAQDLETVYPEMVTDVTDPNPDIDTSTTPAIRKTAEKFKAVNYTQLIAVLIAGIQEQQQQIVDQKADIENLKKQIAALK